MEWNVGDVVVLDAECFGQHIFPLAGIRLNGNSTAKLFDCGIAIAPEIELPALSGLVAAADNIAQDVPAIERCRCPPDKEERGIIAARRKYLGEKFGLGLR